MATLQFHKWASPTLADFLRRAHSIRKLSADGKVSFQISGSFRPEDIEIGLFASIRLRDVAFPELLRRVIHTVIWSPKLPEAFSAEQFLHLVEDEYGSKVSIDTKDFVVISGLLLNGYPPCRNIEYGNVKISFIDMGDDGEGAAFVKKHVQLIEQLRPEEGFPASPAATHFVKIDVSADSAETAESKAKQAFDVVRGLMNFVFNQTKLGTYMLFGNAKPHPINDIPSTPYRTVHFKSTELARDMIWYDRQWSAPKNLVTFDDGEGIRTKNFNYHLSRLSEGHGLAIKAEQAIRIYCRALDKKEWQLSFVELWVVLEVLLLSSPNDSHMRIPERLSRLYKDHGHVLAVSHQMRELRNLFVHEVFEIGEHDAKAILDQLNRFACDAILFASANKLNFESLHEWHEFLDAPLSNDVIKRRIALYERALNFRRHE